jgi:hypothetical protein
MLNIFGNFLMEKIAKIWWQFYPPKKKQKKNSENFTAEK